MGIWLWKAGQDVTCSTPVATSDHCAAASGISDHTNALLFEEPAHGHQHYFQHNCGTTKRNRIKCTHLLKRICHQRRVHYSLSLAQGIQESIVCFTLPRAAQSPFLITALCQLAVQPHTEPVRCVGPALMLSAKAKQILDSHLFCWASETFAESKHTEPGRVGTWHAWLQCPSLLVIFHNTYNNNTVVYVN